MSDRELLELAAKAAGMTVEYDPYASPSGEDDWFITDEGYGWNPRTDDGDALRLAAKVGLVVDFHCPAGVDRIIGTGVWTQGPAVDAPEFWTAHGSDAGAASRYTITRAAAEIGRRTQHE